MLDNNSEASLGILAAHLFLLRLTLLLVSAQIILKLLDARSILFVFLRGLGFAANASR